MKAQNENQEFLMSKNTIYLDTSAAMHFSGFGMFVQQIENALVSANKKIKVLKVVWLELIRNYNSKNKQKAEAANQAISIISNHRNIFDIEESEIFQYEMEHAFADKVLLSSIMLEKTDSSILLITNDKMLSKDALEINHQSSCRGYKVSTCYITESGSLQPGFSKKEDNKSDCKFEEPENRVVKNENEPSEKKWETLVIPMGTLLVGFAIGRYGNQFIKYVKSIA